jgi:hypothetical protein
VSICHAGTDGESTQNGHGFVLVRRPPFAQRCAMRLRRKRGHDDVSIAAVAPSLPRWAELGTAGQPAVIHADRAADVVAAPRPAA